MTHPVDRGWAWVVLVASLGCNYLSGGPRLLCWVIHVELLDKFQDDVTTTAWAGAIYSSLQMLGGTGMGLTYSPTLMTIGFYFSRLRGLASEYSKTMGTDVTRAATLFVGVGIFSLVSRLGSGFLTTGSRVNAFYLSVSLMALCGAATSLFPLYSGSYLGQMVFACLFGLSTGGFYTLINVLTVELVGFGDTLAMAYGMEVFVMGVGYVAGPPLAGEGD
nr:hypothetical protein BaRGS_032553 [Batillaria attramentaria]